MADEPKHRVTVDIALVRGGLDIVSVVATVEGAGGRTVSVQAVPSDQELDAATGRTWTRVGAELVLIVGNLCAMARREPAGWDLSVWSLAHGVRLEHVQELDAKGVAELLSHWPEMRP